MGLRARAKDNKYATYYWFALASRSEPEVQIFKDFLARARKKLNSGDIARLDTQAASFEPVPWEQILRDEKVDAATTARVREQIERDKARHKENVERFGAITGAVGQALSQPGYAPAPIIKLPPRRQ